MSALVFSGIRTVSGDMAWVEHTYQVMIVLNQTDGLVTKSQANAQAYLASGNDTFLDMVEESERQALSTTELIRSMVTDNSVQQQRTIMLQDVIGTVLEASRATLQRTRKTASPAAQGVFAANSVNSDLDRGHVIIATMLQDEQRLLAERRASVSTSTRQTLLTYLVGMAGCVVIFASMFLMIARESAKRAKVELSLTESMEKLAMSAKTSETLALFGDLLQSCRELPEAFRVAERYLAMLIPAESGAVAVINNSRDSVELMGSWGDADGVLSDFAPQGCWSLRRGRIHTYKPGDIHPPCEHLKDHDIPTTCVPLLAHGETHGVMCLRPVSKAGFTAADVQMLHLIRERMSLAIANLKLDMSLRSQSIRDQLTGLFNRRYLEESLQREIARARRQKSDLSLIMLDVDHFKRFNDVHGHECGDLVLQEFGQLLNTAFRGEDVACRYGGEEFMIILVGASGADAVKRAEAVRESVSRMHVVFRGQAMGRISASFGVASFPMHGETSLSLIATADSALYYAKNQGRDRVVSADSLKDAAIAAAG